MGYDIIGDVHGHHEALVALLRHLGYTETGGAWRHPERTALFVGDFIDRGPKQVETVETVRHMVEAGTARAVMGNHELNAIAWTVPDPLAPGEFLRRHAPNKRHQHAAFLAAVESDPGKHRELVSWFLTLPLWLDLDGVRVAHACSHSRYVEALATRLPGGLLTEELLPAAVTRPADAEPGGTLTLYDAVEAVLKGLEVRLPGGASYLDDSGHRRDNVRVRWWDGAATTYRSAAMLVDDDGAWLPEDPIPAQFRVGHEAGRHDFVGHYWMRGEPRPLGPTVACVDYSVAKNGKLVAYRWDGEPELEAGKFAWAG